MKRSDLLPKAILSLACLTAVAACAPSDQSASPGDSYALIPSEISDLEGKANLGDSDATHRLTQHYVLAAPDLAKATHWQRVSAQRGDVGEMINLATSLFVAAGPENCVEARQWLMRAMASAPGTRLAERAQKNLKVHQEVGPCVQWLRPPLQETSNNSFKPKPLRGSA